jgi:hypothetical protein
VQHIDKKQKSSIIVLIHLKKQKPIFQEASVLSQREKKIINKTEKKNKLTL